LACFQEVVPSNFGWKKKVQILIEDKNKRSVWSVVTKKKEVGEM
jgi:hypothetical protein